MRPRRFLLLLAAVLLLVGVGLPYLYLPHPPTDADVLRTLRTRAETITWRGADLTPPTSAAAQPALASLEGIAVRVLGYSVTYVDGFTAATGNYGQTAPTLRTIEVDGTASDTMKLAILAHELGHVLQPPKMDRQENEVFAEAVALLVCRARGLDTFEASAAYVAVYRSGIRALDRQADIAWAVAVLSAR
jgi:hypothetical protein